MIMIVFVKIGYIFNLFPRVITIESKPYFVVHATIDCLFCCYIRITLELYIFRSIED